jgi:ADP-dependent NAD(P)H-hydrate dehydratase
MNVPSGWSYEAMTPLRDSMPPLPEPRAASSKRERGTVVIIAGGRGCPGAALLSATGALRAGAGRVQMITHESHAVALGVAVPETLVIGCASNGNGWHLDPSATDAIRKADVVVVGPGLTSEGPELAERALTEASPDASVLFDAAALAGLETEPLHDRCVLLPNPEEVPLVGGDAPPNGSDPADLADAAAQLALATDAIAVVRGPATAIADPRARVLRVLDDPRPGLGVAGSGDVLTGTVAAYCARACVLAAGVAWGVLVHHEAGRILEQRFGPVGFLAREISDTLTDAARRLTQSARER